jgi:hypothetical protein
MLAGAIDDDAGVSKHIGQAGDERIFRADDDKVDCPLPAKLDEGREVVRSDGDALHVFGNARIAGGAEDFRLLRELPGKRVLASSTSDN